MRLGGVTLRQQREGGGALGGSSDRWMGEGREEMAEQEGGLRVGDQTGEKEERDG